MKIGILGAGISGLTIAKLLGKEYNVEILEKERIHGGIARTKDINGISYHVTGGHCFNSKHQDVLNFVFKEVLPENNWNKIVRNAKIRFKNYEISYPIEFAVLEIAKFDMNLAINIIKDFLGTNDIQVNNLEDWFRKNFGNTLSDEYFIPYNKKIWNKLPSEMDPSWVFDKLPMPNKETFIKSLIQDVKDEMPHSTFYYPKSNNQNTFIDKLAEGLSIIYNYKVEKLEFNNEISKWVINDTLFYDKIINTTPLDQFINILIDCKPEIKNLSNNLVYNKVSTMIWETFETSNTWTYIPDPNIIFHRYIHIGNFFTPKKNYTIVEAIGERSYEEMVENGRKDPFLIKPLGYNVSKHAYVVFNENSITSKSLILKYLEEKNIFCVGRFAEWEYYNMDICIKSALDLFNKFKTKLNENNI